MIGIWPTILFGVSQERLSFRVIMFKGFIFADRSMIGIKRFWGLSELLREKSDMGEKRFISMDTHIDAYNVENCTKFLYKISIVKFILFLN